MPVDELATNDGDDNNTHPFCVQDIIYIQFEQTFEQYIQGKARELDHCFIQVFDVRYGSRCARTRKYQSRAHASVGRHREKVARLT